MAGDKEVVADSDSEWGSDAEEEAPKMVAREQVESGDETEELASETEDEGEPDDEEDEAEAKKAAEAKAKKKADALKAKKAAEAKPKPKAPAKPKVAKSPSKKRKAEGEKPPAASKPAAESKKAEAPAKPKAAKPPEVFATQPLKDGAREGMSAQQERDAFLAHIRAKNNEHQTAVDTFIKAASSDKGKQPKSIVAKFNGDITTGHVLSKDARTLVARDFQRDQTAIAKLERAVEAFEAETGATAAVTIGLPGAKRSRTA